MDRRYTATITRPAAESILCPLCEYDLRGLPREAPPRCPECGASYSSWDELTDPAKRKHKYLFEQNHSVRSFLQTILNSWLPRRFWRSIHPAQPTHKRWLILYWILCTLPLIAVPGTMLVRDVLIYRSYTLAERTTAANFYNDVQATQLITAVESPELAERQRVERAELHARFNKVDDYLDAILPLPPSIKFFRNFINESSLFNLNMDRSAKGAALICIPAMLITPLAVIATLMIFRASMRQAGVRVRHLARVAVYCSDVLFWPGLIGCGVAVTFIIADLRLRNGMRIYTETRDERVLAIVLAGIVVGLLVLTYRLAIAMMIYLQFKHAARMAISVMVILVLCAIELLILTSAI